MSSGTWIVDRLRRVTSSGQYVAEIDGLRFLAIMPVILFHLRNYMLVKSGGLYASPPEQNWLAGMTAHGHYGVELFFVISGLVLGLPFAAHHLKGKRRVALKQYFLRRLTRLEPPYVICMVLCFGLFVFLKKGTVSEVWPHAAAGLFYLHSLVFGTHNPTNLVTWSLEVEIQFYLLVPVLAKLFTIRSRGGRRLTIVALILILVVGQSFLETSTGRLGFSIANYLQYFLAGFLLADIYESDWDGKPTHDVKWDFLSLLGWPALIALLYHPLLTHILLPFLLFALYYSVFRGVYARRLLTWPVITVIGGMCYTIYLIHFQLLSLVGKYRSPTMISHNFAVNFVPELVMFVSVLGVFTVVYFLAIEKPCMRKNWPRSLMKRLRHITGSSVKVEQPIVEV